MIYKHTVLVLGAGASVPYGYPSGKGLTAAVISNLKDQERRAEIKQALKQEDDKFIDSFIESLQKSASTSVDAFLEHRPEFIDLGKLAIAQELITKEREEILYETDNWYQYLFNKLNAILDEFTNNKLSIITFNYDRSLEHFLFTALKHKYNVSDSKSAQCLEVIPIIHVYGQLGNLPWQDLKNNRPYQTSYDVNQLLESSQGVRIVFEKDLGADDLFQKAFKLLQTAYKIYFLGFGYHKLNLSRLKVEELDIANKEILGSCYNMTDREIIDVQDNLMSKKISLRHPHLDVLGFLRTNVNFD